MPGPSERSHSLPNLVAAHGSDGDVRRLYSLSLSQINKNSDLAEYYQKPSPFNLRWIHGYNPKPGLINLNTNGSTTVFYAASNCAVLYNWTTNQMRILQGHRHVVTCLAKDAQGRWLVTVDSGPENIIIIWDSNDYFPQRTIFAPHGETRIANVAISADAKYLLTLAYAKQTTLHWWIWCLGMDQPHAKLEVDLPRDSVLAMSFNGHDSNQFLLMTKHDIWIGVSGKIFVMERGIIKETNDYELKIRKVEKKIRPEYGKLTCYTFVGTTCQVLVGTSRGAVLVYGYTIDYQENIKSTDHEHLKFIKPLKVEKCKINVIKNIDGVIITGNNSGEIHFYDEQMKLKYWVHGFKVDSVRGMSFNVTPRSCQIFDPRCKLPLIKRKEGELLPSGTGVLKGNKPCPCWEKVVAEVDPETGMLRQKLLKQKLPSDATTGERPFLVRDFIVCTSNQGVGFVDFATEKLHTILDNKVSPALALTVHPEKPFVCIGYADGFIELFNFLQHNLFLRLDLRNHYKVVIPPDDDSIKCEYEVIIPDLAVTCLKYSPSGLHLACGLNTGELLFLDPTTMSIITETPFKDTSYKITEINFSLDSLTMAFADTGRTVGVYKYDCEKYIWTFIGKHRAHYKEISTVFFLPQKNNGEYKLLSIGKDRIMVEYDIATSSEDYLEIYSLDRMEQTAVPLAGIVWPTPKGLDPEQFKTDLPMILIANDEHKYKILNYATTMTLATVLGPRYEHPVRKMQLISRTEDDVEFQYILFATKNIIGLQKMPLDGNPWKHVGLLGHPVQITQMCFREDLGILFTIGTKDSTMSQWAANYRSVETTTKRGGGDLDPYYCLIEKGRPGWLFQEIRDLFYYIQILCQGTFSPAMRRVNDYIPIDSLPDLMRALGFFPSEYEVENLVVEAKHKVYLRDPVTVIDFEEFVKLYLNHRPARCESFNRVSDAFRAFATPHRDGDFMYREDFVDMLNDHGERFSRELSWYLLSILWGLSFEDRASMAIGDFSFLPEKISFTELVTNIIGIHELAEAERGAESASQQTFGTREDSDDS